MSGYLQSLTWGVASEAGASHSANEDSYLASPPVFVVADGMGGHLGGLTASQLAVSAFRSLEGRGCTTDDVVRAIDDANSLICSHAAADPLLMGMGTTVTGVVLVTHDDREVWLLFNVGDSRVYHSTGNSLTQLTVDHSVVQELVDEGELTPREALTDPRRNMVTRALGSDDTPEVDFWVVTPQPGETFLVCSDGLTGTVSMDELQAVLSGERNPADKAAAIAELAVHHGATDDVTALVVCSQSLGAPSSSDVPTRERRKWSSDVTVPRERLMNPEVVHE